MIMVTERVLDGIMGYGSYRVDTKHLEHTSDYNLPAQARAHSKNGWHCKGHDSWWHGVNLNVCGFP